MGRVGAFVLLEDAIGRDDFIKLSRRPYHGEHAISVDDAQPGNPRCAGKICPRLTGPSGYCRGWNIRGHASTQRFSLRISNLGLPSLMRSKQSYAGPCHMLASLRSSVHRMQHLKKCTTSAGPSYTRNKDSL